MMKDSPHRAAKLMEAINEKYASWTLKTEKAEWTKVGLRPSIRASIVQYQIIIPMILFFSLISIHTLFPTLRPYTRKFYELSYLNLESGDYGAGSDDVFIVASWILIVITSRVTVIQYILITLGKRAGIETRRDQVRFAEQAWLLLCAYISWTTGMYIMTHSDYWLNLKELWTHWPNREIGGLQKWYILIQHAFWISQILTINIEEPRKDYWQMLVHHIITSGLIFTSYTYNQTKVANVMLCITDAVDLFFPLAKCLKYLGYSKLCDFVFGLFILTWLIARHILYLAVCYSVWVDIPAIINLGCYSGENAAMTGPFPPPDRFLHLFGPLRDSHGVVCFTQNVKRGFLTGLLFLQSLQIMWFVMIVKVAIKVLKGGEAEDNRSEDEGDEVRSCVEGDEGELLQHFDKTRFLGEGQVAMAVNPRSQKSGFSKRHRTATSNSTGVSFTVRDARKEFLGRIGCDKGI